MTQEQKQALLQSYNAGKSIKESYKEWLKDYLAKAFAIQDTYEIVDIDTALSDDYDITLLLDNATYIDVYYENGRRNECKRELILISLTDYRDGHYGIDGVEATTYLVDSYDVEEPILSQMQSMVDFINYCITKK